MLATFAAAVCLLSFPADRTNMIVILVDDLGWQDTSLSFGLKEKVTGRHFRTPNLERLAARGLTVNQAYSASPVCTPSRASLLSGLSPARTRITNWVATGGDTDPNHPAHGKFAWASEGLQAGKWNLLPGLFQRGLFDTAYFGKAHFGAGGTSGAHPTTLGFSTAIGGGALGHPNSYYGLQNFAAKKKSPSDPPAFNDVPGLEKYHGKDIFLDEALALEAADYIRTTASTERRFFMVFAPYSVHTPIQPNKRYLKKYLDKGLDPTEAAYATMVETVDAALGTLVQALRQAKQLDNTIIIFTSDNGGLSQSARGGIRNQHNLPLRSGKGSAYEGGIRVPFVIAGPGIPQGKVLKSTPVITTDLAATLWALQYRAPQKDAVATKEDPSPQQEEVPKFDHLFRDSGNLADNFRNAREAPQRSLYWHYPHYRGLLGPGLEPFSAIRKGDYKLIYFYLDQRWELYNLSNDIGETMNLARIPNGKNREVGSDLAARLIGYLKECNAQYPVDGKTGAPIEPSFATFGR